MDQMLYRAFVVVLAAAVFASPASTSEYYCNLTLQKVSEFCHSDSSHEYYNCVKESMEARGYYYPDDYDSGEEGFKCD